jgi:deoxyribodipyrimidine photolyase-related protein
MSKPKEITTGLILSHQLFFEHPIVKHGVDRIVMVEESLLFNQFRFHKIKLAFHRASMKAYFDQLDTRKEYVSAQDHLSDIRKLIHHLADQGVNNIVVVDPTDNYLERRISQSCQQNNLELTVLDSPLFMNSRPELESFFASKTKKFFQTSWYIEQRKKREILIVDVEPTGGKWSFDQENRKKYPKSQTPPPIPVVIENEYTREATAYVNKYYPKNPGTLERFPLFPSDRLSALEWLDQFFNLRFHGFGPYEDAIVKSEVFLHHSVLTPMLNVGLITPNEVIDRALSYAKNHNIPINSLEGFVRQIVGWREFIRGLYEHVGTKQRTKNFWGFNRPIPSSFYDGTTGIEPLDDTIKKVLNHSYCHHIERLMILGNFMLLCEFDPDEVYRWFMELFIDAYDWVMVPNVYGMSQFADGGLMATKPYISGSNYILKMSNYKKGNWQKTWDGLFWRFMDKHRDFFLSNPRLGMLVRTFDKMDADKRTAHLEAAETYLKHLN